MSQNIEAISDVTLKLASFEGPLDLLLHLIKDSEMDIYDIQISEITDYYLSIINHAEKMSLEVIGQYLVMASTLMKIKSQMLLPVEVSEIEETQIDPRTDLVKQLIDYQIFKDAAGELGVKASNRANYFSKEQSRVPKNDFVNQQLDIPGLDLESLQNAFKRVLMKQVNQQPVEKKIKVQQFSLTDKILEIERIVTNSIGRLTFDDLFEDSMRVDEIVITFLAILELSKLNQIELKQVNSHENIQILKIEP
ncbi:segregation and condensation protein A [Dellaglioa sp. L3N]